MKAGAMYVSPRTTSRIPYSDLLSLPFSDGVPIAGYLYMNIPL